MARQLEMEMTIHGMVVKVGDEIVSRGAWSDGEIDYQVDRLIKDLEALRRRMKIAAKNRKPPSLEITDDANRT